MKQVEVVFCGNSLYLCMLASGLQQNKRFRISMTDCELADAVPELNMLRPDVLIFEAANHSTAMIDHILRAKFYLVTVAVYPETDSLEAAWGDRHCTASVDSLARVVIESMENLEKNWLVSQDEGG